MLILCLNVSCSESEWQTGKWWNGAKLEEGISMITTIFAACTACIEAMSRDALLLSQSSKAAVLSVLATLRPSMGRAA